MLKHHKEDVSLISPRYCHASDGWLALLFDCENRSLLQAIPVIVTTQNDGESDEVAAAIRN